jgi:hypothetical protein
MLFDQDREFLTTTGAQCLGVGQAFDGSGCIENHSRRDDRPGQRPAADLVHSRH